MPIVSIITPCFNAEKYIKETIHSVLNQSFQDWEWLITDDHSSDQSVIILEGIEDERIKVIKLSENKGAGNARNISLNKAQGRYIAFLDSDDFWEPNYLEEMIKCMHEKNVELVYSSYARCDENLIPILKDLQATEKITFSDLLKTCTFAPVSTIYDSQRVGKEFFPIESKREDHVMWLNLLKKIPYGEPLNLTLSKYRMREDSVSRSKLPLIKDQYLVYKKFMYFNTIKSIYYTLIWSLNGFKKYSKWFKG